MWVEADCDPDATHHTVVGRNLVFQKGTVKVFNKKYRGQAFICRQRLEDVSPMPREKPEQTTYFLLMKVDPEADESENLYPFENTEEAEKYLLLLEKECYGRIALFKREKEIVKARMKGKFYAQSVRLVAKKKAL